MLERKKPRVCAITKKVLSHNNCQTRLWLHAVSIRKWLWLYKADGAVPDRHFVPGKSWSSNGFNSMVQEYGQYLIRWSSRDRGIGDKNTRMEEIRAGNV